MHWRHGNQEIKVLLLTCNVILKSNKSHLFKVYERKCEQALSEHIYFVSAKGNYRVHHLISGNNPKQSSKYFIFIFHFSQFPAFLSLLKTTVSSDSDIKCVCVCVCVCGGGAVCLRI